jgi:hypothetical protein
VKESNIFAATNAIQVRIDENVRMLAELYNILFADQLRHRSTYLLLFPEICLSHRVGSEGHR